MASMIYYDNNVHRFVGDIKVIKDYISCYYSMLDKVAASVSDAEFEIKFNTIKQDKVFINDAFNDLSNLESKLMGFIAHQNYFSILEAMCQLPDDKNKSDLLKDLLMRHMQAKMHVVTQIRYFYYRCIRYFADGI